MKNIFIVLTSIFFVCHLGYSNEIFISTDPINAYVWLEDELIGKTPLRLHDPMPDSVNIAIKKDGFQSIEEEIRLKDSRTELVFYNLFPIRVDLVLNQKEKQVYLNDVHAGKSPLIVKNIPSGIYQIESENGNIHISNAEYKQLRKTTILETVFTAGLFAASLAGVFQDYNSGGSGSTPALRVSSLIFGGILGYDLLKLYKIRTGMKQERWAMGAIEITSFDREDDRDLFASGMGLIGRESWTDALEKFNLLVNVYPDSQFVPLSVYEMGYSYYQMGDYGKAADYFRKFSYDFPVYEFYYHAVYYLMDTKLLQGRYSEALDDYDRLRPLYLDDASGDIYGLYYDILVGLYEGTGSIHNYILNDLIRELDYFMDNYKDSLSYADILFLKGKIHYRYLDREVGLDIFNEIRENFSYRKELMSEMENIGNVR